MSIPNDVKIVRIVISNWSGKVLEVKDFSKSLLEHFQDASLDWMHSCGGKGRCTTCKVIVLSGADAFTERTPAELRYKGQGLLGDDERLSCQVRVRGHITVAVPEEYKLPHIDYGSESAS